MDGKPEPAPLLFALHTYYALLIKLLAAEIVSFFNPWMTRQVEKLLNATVSAKLKRELEQLERGGIFHEMGITNFLEGDLFSWYLAVWSDPIERLTRQMIQKLDEYNPGTFSEDPVQSRDLLKKLYQHLFPKSVRHDLGEYYTPDWLAEHVLNELGYVGDPDKRILDPACGSGTFLVMAINRIRSWYEENREKCSYDEGELLKKILANVIGFDLNPLAVMAARTNYLVAIKDFIRHVDTVEIPIYLCDSILTPAEYGDLFTGRSNVARVPCSAMKPPYLLVPSEIAKNPREVAKYAAVLETCVKNAYSSNEFLERCQDEGLEMAATDTHVDLYNELVRLDKENKNGIWARIIKNNFAPLFVQKVDYLAGNPPWVNWSNLPKQYRDSTGPAWTHYKLFPHQGLRARSGSAMDDISVLMTYVAADCYLKNLAQLGFVITQSVFRTEGGGEGFRRFQIGDGDKLAVLKVSDLSALQPFEGATNRTATFTIEKGRGTTYPVSYTVWKPVADITSDMTLNEVDSAVARNLKTAKPVSAEKDTSPWIVGTETELSAAAKCFGRSDYQGRYGTHCHASGIYWLEVIEARPRDHILVRNLGEVGKTKYPIVEHLLDGRFVFPLARGRDVERWSVHPRCSMVLPQQTHDPAKAIPEAELRAEAPETYSYFKLFEQALRERSGFKKFFRPGIDPFYSVYNVGAYTFAKHKVLWREVAQDLRAAVSEGTDQPLVPDHTLVLAPAETSAEAHYLCAVLNSSPANFIVANYVALHPAPHVLKYIRIPRFDNRIAEHRELSALSRNAHIAVAEADLAQVDSIETQVDTCAARLWGMGGDELRAMQTAIVAPGKH
ncbi:MAG TPA: N-6 DNA methylase [Candidatus Acidoferrales bacterium]|nr:N-6 DNA methylase [Candidatus Acidoferrales bacterium]